MNKLRLFLIIGVIIFLVSISSPSRQDKESSGYRPEKKRPDQIGILCSHPYCDFSVKRLRWSGRPSDGGRSIYHLLLYLGSKKKGPITFTPTVPFPQEALKELSDRNRVPIFVPEARIFCGDPVETPGWFHDKTYYAIQEMNEWMKWIFDLKSIVANEELYRIKPKISVPDDARIISIKMEGFKHGRSCHDFVPIFGMTAGSYFTYQMFGENKIQVTNYVENGVTYVAGFCIYISNPWLWGVRFNKEVVQNCMKSPKYPSRQSQGLNDFLNAILNRVEDETSQAIQTDHTKTERRISEHSRGDQNACSSSTAPNNDDTISLLSESIHLDENPTWEVLHCSKLQRNIMSSIEFGSLAVVHQEWDPMAKEMKTERCKNCTEQAKKELPPPYSSLGLK